MSNNDEPCSFSEHPLFRALVLMGGSLALGCGGVAQSEHVTESGGADPGPATSTSTSTAGSAASGSGGSGGSTSVGGPILVAKEGASSGGAASTGPGSPTEAACPYAQWDCSQLEPSCARDLSQGLTGLGCFCNRARPLTANDCGPTESLFCLQGFASFDAPPGTWDYTFHIQCSCAPTPDLNEFRAPTDACLKLFPVQSRNTMAGHLPPRESCDGTVCTATSADVLRQDGIMCGCADIGLK